MRTLIAAIKFLAFILLCLLIAPAQMLILLFYKGRYAYILPHFWHKGVCAIFQIRLSTQGTIIKDRQVFFVSNHLSYLDICAIATQICFASFVAKADVERWPVFGFLSKLQQTIFISRSRSAATKESNALDEAMVNGKNLILFPEGTSTEGISIYPFKSSLFELFLKEKYKHILIQPITLVVKSVDGKPPLTREERNVYAWPFDDEIGLGPHLLRFAKSRGAEITLIFHEPISVDEFSDRKALAKTCHDAVSKGLEFNTTANRSPYVHA